MTQFILLTHILGAIGMGFYLILPFCLKEAFLQKTSILQLLYRANFVIQWILVAQLFTGGYLYSQVTYSMLWTFLMMIIFLAIGAFGGMFGYYTRHFLQTSDPSEFPSWIKKIRFHAICTSITFLVIIILMVFSHQNNGSFSYVWRKVRYEESW
ncbi:hypothetical protein MK805_08040 [Shimazuella sp. AN120528]|uniref:hypothetical protein n=1 Tax=Shimazuella soli TaxID=1892854 RepID=UPI001F0ED5BB|nr:hypothetical protein [Shimazuella soli]MCH5584922.1 hypothetical protein [Shimazuella soli]